MKHLINFKNKTFALKFLETIEVNKHWEKYEVEINTSNDYMNEYYDTEKQAKTRKAQIEADWLIYLSKEK